MLYYFVPLYSFLLLSVYYLIQPKRELKIVWNIVALCPVIIFLSYIAIFRDISIGTDTLNYQSLFYDPEEDLEISYRYLSEWVDYFDGEFRVFLALFFIIAFSTKLYTFAKSSYSTLLALVIYSGMWFLVYDMNGIRQGAALGLVCVAYYFLFKNDTLFSFIFICLAMLFHSTSIIFIPFLLIVRFKCTKKLFVLILFISLFLAAIKFTEIIISFLSHFENMGIRVIDRAMSYQNNQQFNNESFFSFKTVARLIILALVCFLIDRMGLDEQRKNIILWGMLLSVVIYLLCSQYELIATRLSLYYRLSEIFFFSAFPMAFKGRSSKIIAVAIVCLYASLNIYQTLALPDNNLYPYKSIFS